MTIRGKYKGADAAAASAYYLDNRQRVQKVIDDFRNKGLIDEIKAMEDSPEFSTPRPAPADLLLECTASLSDILAKLKAKPRR